MYNQVCAAEPAVSDQQEVLDLCECDRLNKSRQRETDLLLFDEFCFSWINLHKTSSVSDGNALELFIPLGSKQVERRRKKNLNFYPTRSCF